MTEIKYSRKRKINIFIFEFLGIGCFSMFFFGFVFGFLNKKINNFLPDGYLGLITVLCFCIYVYFFLAPMVENAFIKSEQDYD